MAECAMYHEPPYDFAWCETHDETFPLGSVCRFHPNYKPSEPHVHEYKLRYVCDCGEHSTGLAKGAEHG